jgi:hypothetical protein
MAQTVGSLVTQDGEKGGIVASVGSAQVTQPDKVTHDSATGEELSREPQPPLDVQTVHVKWEDGTESDLTEHIDQWSTLGSVVIFPSPAEDPVGAVEGDDQAKAKVNAALGDVAGTFAEVRAAAPIYAQAVEDARQTEVVDDPTFTATLVSGQQVADTSA